MSDNLGEIHEFPRTMLSCAQESLSPKRQRHRPDNTLRRTCMLSLVACPNHCSTRTCREGMVDSFIQIVLIVFAVLVRCTIQVCSFILLNLESLLMHVMCFPSFDLDNRQSTPQQALAFQQKQTVYVFHQYFGFDSPWLVFAFVDL